MSASRKKTGGGQKEIARRLGVSQTTVSYVMSGQARERHVAKKTEERVLQVAHEMGYVANGIARSLREQMTRSLGILHVGFGYSWAHRINNGLEPVLSEAGFLPLHLVRGWDPVKERREITALLERRVDGILIVNPVAEGIDNYRLIEENGVPLLFVSDYLPDFASANYVVWDSGLAARHAVERILESGRKRVAFVGMTYGTVMTQARFDGYEKALEEHSAEFDKHWTLWQDLRRPAVTRGDDIREWLRGVFEKGKKHPDAFFVLNDLLAGLVVDGLLDLGFRVPDDVAVVGIGNLPIRVGGNLRLTTVDEPLERLGKASAEAMLRLVKDPGSLRIQEQVIAHEIVSGDTL